jgi:hypothetical protein
LVPSVDGGDDFVGIGSPDEWLGIMIGLGNESVDGGLELDERSEDTALIARRRSRNGDPAATTFAQGTVNHSSAPLPVAQLERFIFRKRT